jgi:hypothetical protein
VENSHVRTAQMAIMVNDPHCALDQWFEMLECGECKVGMVSLSFSSCRRSFTHCQLISYHRIYVHRQLVSCRDLMGPSSLRPVDMLDIFSASSLKLELEQKIVRITMESSLLHIEDRMKHEQPCKTRQEFPQSTILRALPCRSGERGISRTGTKKGINCLNSRNKFEVKLLTAEDLGSAVEGYTAFSD